MTSPLLEVRNLKKYYAKPTSWFGRKEKLIKVVDDVSFTIEKKQTVGIVGESGSGKSTTALCTMALLPPTSGQIFFLGKEMQKLSASQLRAVRRDLQMIFQNPFTSLNPRKTVLENITTSLKVHGLVKSEEERVAKGYEILHKVGLERSALFQYPHQFSGGQQQRIAIGRALVLGPKLLICDEAVSALDLSVQAEILNLLYQLKRDFHLSYLFISHDLSVVNAFCDHILVMYRGKIVESGPREQIFTAPKHPYTQMLLQSRLKSHPREKRELMILPEEHIHEENKSGCPFYSRCPKRESGCEHHMPAQKRDEQTNHRYSCIY